MKATLFALGLNELLAAFRIRDLFPIYHNVTRLLKRLNHIGDLFRGESSLWKWDRIALCRDVTVAGRALADAMRFS
jgi:hypothetical protein